MKRGSFAVVVVFLTLAAAWLRHELSRGSFDAVEKHFVSWLAANDGSRPVVLPPLTVVLYDDESSKLAGAGGMRMLDGALFARAASTLGASAAGVAGLSGDPRRMVEAAHGMRIFGGYPMDEPPGEGWTPLRGEPAPGWPEIHGLAGRQGAFARGFVSIPTGAAGARRACLLARSAASPVPSFLVLAWAAAQGLRAGDLVAGPYGVQAGARRIAVDGAGNAWFYPETPRVMTMNDLLVASERFEREGGPSPLQGNVLILARATTDVVRLATDGANPATPAEVWASAWEPLRNGRLFIAPGWWFLPALVAVSAVLAIVASGCSRRRAAFALFFSLLVFLLLSLGVFAGTHVCLPLVPVVLTMTAGVFAGWLVRVSGLAANRQNP